jgi:hypothetical protein
MLRAGLLEGIVVATAGGAAHVASACAALGASTVALEGDLGDEDAVVAAASALRPVGTLGAAGPFAAGEGCRPRRRARRAWIATRAVANAAGCRATAASWCSPRPATAHAGALGAALENTARTLSVGGRATIRTTAVLPATPRPTTSPSSSHLASPAGDYFSGCAHGRAEARLRRNLKEAHWRDDLGHGRDRPADRRAASSPTARTTRVQPGPRDRRRPTALPAGTVYASTVKDGGVKFKREFG